MEQLGGATMEGNGGADEGMGTSSPGGGLGEKRSQITLLVGACLALRVGRSLTPSTPHPPGPQRGHPSLLEPQVPDGRALVPA